MKIKFLLLLCIATLGLASCKKETIVQETQNRTFNYTILPSDWTTSDNGLTYSTTLNVNEIDQITLDDEGVLVYLNHPSDVANPDAYIQLPYVYNVDAYSYKLSKGKIRIDIQSSDDQNNLAIKPTKNLKAKIVILPSKYVP
ncbi:hypothetical protein [Pedobacter nutrimenti]|uniref:hypothetical protein n=1 Tax=Pedobacter nutrimenti TaxID=1241337 RepID=UPI002930FCFB|nr:hypothetical protein [Pedobacter nutrimenti]